MFKGYNCLITGASRGLGAEIALVFWESGANLLLTARSKERLQDVAGRLPERPKQRVLTFSADLSGPDGPRAVFDRARTAFDKLDVLVNNAGVQGPVGLSWQVDWQDWLETLHVNAIAPVQLCRLCVPWIAEHGGGKIINLSGGGATSPRPRVAAYGMAKAALVHFSETLAEEVRHLGITVNCVAPGAMNTDIHQSILDMGPETAGEDEYGKALEVRESGGVPCRRAAELCRFLASSESTGVTGKLISAVWDPWEELSSHLDEFDGSDIYTLRRIVPSDRGKAWGERL